MEKDNEATQKAKQHLVDIKDSTVGTSWEGHTVNIYLAGYKQALEDMVKTQTMTDEEIKKNAAVIVKDLAGVGDRILSLNTLAGLEEGIYLGYRIAIKGGF